MDESRIIGLLIGREWTWPSAFMAEINDNYNNVTAELVSIGPSFAESSVKYDLIIDRMSHVIPYYRTYLKFAALHGCKIINNPFMAAADDKFFGISLGKGLGIKTPKTVALPNKRVETENTPEYFRNLIYPMDWHGIIDYVGVPAILKDVLTGGRRVAQRVNNVDELIRWYDESDTLTVILQEIIESDNHLHMFVVGRDKVLAAQYSLTLGKYLDDSPAIDPELFDQIIQSSIDVTEAYGYDINMVEFVIKDEQAILINPTNPAPDMDILSIDQFNWCVHEISRFAISALEMERSEDRQSLWRKLIAS